MFTLLASLIIWQYMLPLTVHPIEHLHRSTVLPDNHRTWALSFSQSFLTVVSSSACMVLSIMAFTSSICFKGLPLPGFLAVLHVIFVWTRKSFTPLLFTMIPSSSNDLMILGALWPLEWKSIVHFIYSWKPLLFVHSPSHPRHFHS